METELGTVNGRSMLKTENLSTELQYSFANKQDHWPHVSYSFLNQSHHEYWWTPYLLDKYEQINANHALDCKSIPILASQGVTKLYKSKINFFKSSFLELKK